jgi:predicted nucleotidyltransferase component of viral defense system
MFYRPQHLQIDAVLQQLNSTIFHENFAYFGGGTLIALTHDEYRQSNDIDFICSLQSSGYKQLRTQIFDQGYRVLFQPSEQITIGRATTDQYGIRLVVEIDSNPIKLEIIAEARFLAGKPQQLPWLSLPCLNQEDLWTSKLLANADRFMDSSILSRDLIDLAVLRLSSPIPTTSLKTAEAAKNQLGFQPNG